MGMAELMGEVVCVVIVNVCKCVIFPLQALCFVKITENILVFFLFFEFSCCFYWCVCVVLFCFVVLVWFVFFVCLPLTVGVITAFRRGMKAGLLAFSTSRRYNGSKGNHIANTVWYWSTDNNKNKRKWHLGFQNQLSHYIVGLHCWKSGCWYQRKKTKDLLCEL